MNLRQEILAEHSKEQCNKIVAWVGSSQKRFNELFHLFLHDEWRVVQRSAWPVSYSVQAHPSLILPHFNELLAQINNNNAHPAVRRNGLRILEYVQVPEDSEGLVMDACFRFLEDPAETIGSKAFSIKMLTKLSQKYPEIIPEVRLLLHDQLPHATPGFKSAATAFFKKHGS